MFQSSSTSADHHGTPFGSIDFGCFYCEDLSLGKNNIVVVIEVIAGERATEYSAEVTL
jgi:hypothetical protein